MLKNKKIISILIYTHVLKYTPFCLELSSAAAVFDTSKASPVKMVENIEKLVNGKFKARIQVKN